MVRRVAAGRTNSGCVDYGRAFAAPRFAGAGAWWRARVRATKWVSRLIQAGQHLHTPRGFSADSSIRQTLSGPGWVALGEAAAAYDPLTGRGVALALTKGAALARLIASEDISAAIATYVAAEREMFAGYATERAHIYSQAAHRFTTPFWASFR